MEKLGFGTISCLYLRLSIVFVFYWQSDIFLIASHIPAILWLRGVGSPDLFDQIASEITRPRCIRTSGIWELSNLPFLHALVIASICRHPTLTGRHLFLGRRQRLEKCQAHIQWTSVSIQTSWCHWMHSLKEDNQETHMPNCSYMDLNVLLEFF
jgi:hypothetical protein